MKSMIQGQNGRYCMAKTCFLLSVLTCIGVIIHMPEKADYQGMAIFLGAVGAVYFGRSHTKAVVDKGVQ